jgi:hypothetical protein
VSQVYTEGNLHKKLGLNKPPHPLDVTTEKRISIVSHTRHGAAKRDSNVFREKMAHHDSSEILLEEEADMDMSSDEEKLGHHSEGEEEGEGRYEIGQSHALPPKRRRVDFPPDILAVYTTDDDDSEKEGTVASVQDLGRLPETSRYTRNDGAPGVAALRRSFWLSKGSTGNGNDS